MGLGPIPVRACWLFDGNGRGDEGREEGNQTYQEDGAVPSCDPGWFSTACVRGIETRPEHPPDEASGKDPVTKSSDHDAVAPMREEPGRSLLKAHGVSVKRRALRYGRTATSAADPGVWSATMTAMPPELDRAGRSPLHYAALQGDAELVAALIADGADVHLADSNGFTPLHFAAQAQRDAVARVLLAAGAPVDAQDQYGKTPLSVALFHVRDGDGAVVRVLLSAGADPEVENHYGVSPRRLAETVANYDLMRFFR